MRTFVGYAYLENKIQEIYEEDFPEYSSYSLPFGLSFFNESTRDSFVVFSNKQDLVKEFKQMFSQELESIEKEISRLSMHRISIGIQLNDLEKVENEN